MYVEDIKFSREMQEVIRGMADALELALQVNSASEYEELKKRWHASGYLDRKVGEHAIKTADMIAWDRHERASVASAS